MTDAQDQCKVNLNQNLWDVVVGLIAMGAGERYRLYTLYWFSAVVSVIMLLSLGVATFA